jgi:hypothetical protein
MHFYGCGLKIGFLSLFFNFGLFWCVGTYLIGMWDTTTVGGVGQALCGEGEKNYPEAEDRGDRQRGYGLAAAVCVKEMSTGV